MFLCREGSFIDLARLVFSEGYLLILSVQFLCWWVINSSDRVLVILRRDLSGIPKECSVAMVVRDIPPERKASPGIDGSVIRFIMYCGMWSLSGFRSDSCNVSDVCLFERSIHSSLLSDVTLLSPVQTDDGFMDIVPRGSIRVRHPAGMDMPLGFFPIR